MTTKAFGISAIRANTCVTRKRLKVFGTLSVLSLLGITGLALASASASYPLPFQHNPAFMAETAVAKAGYVEIDGVLQRITDNSTWVVNGQLVRVGSAATLIGQKPGSVVRIIAQIDTSGYLVAKSITPIVAASVNVQLNAAVTAESTESVTNTPEPTEISTASDTDQSPILEATEPVEDVFQSGTANVLIIGPVSSVKSRSVTIYDRTIIFQSDSSLLAGLKPGMWIRVLGTFDVGNHTVISAQAQVINSLTVNDHTLLLGTPEPTGIATGTPEATETAEATETPKATATQEPTDTEQAKTLQPTLMEPTDTQEPTHIESTETEEATHPRPTETQEATHPESTEIPHPSGTPHSQGD